MSDSGRSERGAFEAWFDREWCRDGDVVPSTGDPVMWRSYQQSKSWARSAWLAARQSAPPQECQAFCEECGIQKHVLVPQGNDYTDLVCQLCFGNTCRFSGAPQTPALQGEMPPALDYETEHAIVEGYQNHASQEYFYARVALHDSPLNRRIFEAGFKAAVRKGSELARAVRQAEQMRNLTTQIAAATPQVAEGGDGTKKRDVFLAIANLEVAALEGEGKDFPYPPLVKARRAIHKLCGVSIEVSGTDEYEVEA